MNGTQRRTVAKPGHAPEEEAAGGASPPGDVAGGGSAGSGSANPSGMIDAYKQGSGTSVSSASGERQGAEDGSPAGGASGAGGSRRDYASKKTKR